MMAATGVMTCDDLLFQSGDGRFMEAESPSRHVACCLSVQNRRVLGVGTRHRQYSAFRPRQLSG